MRNEVNSMPARIIEFEGLDCSFKENNSKKLKENLAKMGYDVYLFSFPNYESDSSDEVRKFLSGSHPLSNSTWDKEDMYQICDIFAKDRAITYERDIKDIYENGDDKTIIIFDRWIYSNLYHRQV